MNKNISFLKNIFSLNFAYIMELPRIKIWMETIMMIMQKPFFGYGAGTFFINYFVLRGGSGSIHHTHNMPLEIAYNYGIFPSIILTSFISLLCMRGWKAINKSKNYKNNIMDKSFLLSVIVLVIIHLTDITYYEGRIGILIWTLLAGLKCIIDEKTTKQIL